jgi:hypothetical protein
MADLPEQVSRPAATDNQSSPFMPYLGLSRLNQKLSELDKEPFRPVDQNARPFLPTLAPFAPSPPVVKPAGGDNQPRPLDLPPFVIPPFTFPSGDNPVKPVDPPADRPTAIVPGPDGRIEITEKDFDKIGPKARQVLLDAGVTRLTITPGQGYDTYEAYLKKPLEIAQDPNVDGTRKLRIDCHFRADVKKGADGTLMLDNIQGLTAESKILLRFREAKVEKIQLRATPDGKSEITSVGSWNGMSGTKTRVQPGEVFEKANILFERMQKLKEASSLLEIPPLPVR